MSIYPKFTWLISWCFPALAPGLFSHIPPVWRALRGGRRHRTSPVPSVAGGPGRQLFFSEMIYLVLETA